MFTCQKIVLIRSGWQFQKLPLNCFDHSFTLFFSQVCRFPVGGGWVPPLKKRCIWIIFSLSVVKSQTNGETLRNAREVYYGDREGGRGSDFMRWRRAGLDGGGKVLMKGGFLPHPIVDNPGKCVITYLMYHTYISYLWLSEASTMRLVLVAEISQILIPR